MMEAFAFSHNDEQYRITARPGEYLKLYSIDNDDDLIDFIPPPENRYDQILRVKFGLGQDTFQKIRHDQFPSWRITEIIFYGAALSVCHTCVFDKPIMKQSGSRPFHGVHAEQVYTETIPYENISPGDSSFSVKVFNTADNELRDDVTVSVFKNDVVIVPPNNMEYHVTRVYL